MGEIKDLTELDPDLELSLAPVAASNDDGEESSVEDLPESIEQDGQDELVDSEEDSQNNE